MDIGDLRASKSSQSKKEKCGSGRSRGARSISCGILEGEELVTTKATAALIDLEDTAGRNYGDARCLSCYAAGHTLFHFGSGRDRFVDQWFCRAGPRSFQHYRRRPLERGSSVGLRSQATEMLPGVPAHRRRSTLCDSEPGPRPTPQRCCPVARGRSATNLRLDANSRPMKTKKGRPTGIQCLQGRLWTCFRCSASFTQPQAVVNWKK